MAPGQRRRHTALPRSDDQAQRLWLPAVSRPEAFTFASSTATSISDRAYAGVAGTRQVLLREAQLIGLDRAVDVQMERQRIELKQILDLDDNDCEIVFSPSGTDSQMHALFLARALLGAPLISLIAASDETGSGATFATRGRHFNGVTAQGVPVTKGEPIQGLSDGVIGARVPLRDGFGRLRPIEEIDGDVAHTVAREVAAGKHVVLWAMDSSKFGLRSPSEDCLRWIADFGGHKVMIVIDACQARLGRARIRWYLEPASRCSSPVRNLHRRAVQRRAPRSAEPGRALRRH